MEHNAIQLKEQLKRIMKAQLFIQEHLDEELKLEDVAKAAHCSAYHFHRIFRACTGESPGEFIRRLRLEKAAGQLKYTRKPVTDVALDSGYQTPASFTRAFRQLMGVSPRDYRQNSSGQDQSKHRSYQEHTMITPTFETLEDQSVLFVRTTGPYMESPRQAWTTVNAYSKEAGLPKGRCFSIGLDDPNVTAADKLRFDACITAPASYQGSSEVHRQVLPGGKFAVFTHKGRYDELEQTFDRIFLEWFPGNEDKVADAPCLCEHMNKEMMGTPEQLITKIYVPLK